MTITLEQALQAAVAHHQTGRIAEAEALYRQVLAVQPQNPDALHLLGVLAMQVGQHEAAIDLILRAIAINASAPAFHSNIGEAYRSLRQWDNAILGYEKALALKPDYPEAHNNLGLAQVGQDNMDEAVHCYKRALSYNSDFPEAHYNLGNAYFELMRPDEAITCYRRALALRPEYAEAVSNLGAVLTRTGQVEDALACYRQAMTLRPTEAAIHSNLIYAMQFGSKVIESDLKNEYRRWEQQQEVPRRPLIRSPRNSADPDRRLKIGYVSPDLRQHPVGRFLLPLLQHHNHDHFEVTCYADTAKPDTITSRLRARSGRWRETLDWSEDRLARQIMEDGIDVLIDLALHTGGNRLPLFARRPAPVQVTYLAYPGTSGLAEMDYRLTDPYLDPLDASDDDYSEISFRLPQTYWCYSSPTEAPDVSALPASWARRVTFGCLNSFSKINRGILAIWARVIRATPESRILLHAPDGSCQDWVREVFAQEDIVPEHVEFASHLPLAEYYIQYAKIDIALDTFPYTGGTTTCDALWMGVPVVSLAGETATSRGGLSILSNVGMPELVAYSEDEYIKIAKDLAKDLRRLAELRATMRDRMQASPLMDAPRFTRNIEDAYRTMWKTWCQDRTESKT